MYESTLLCGFQMQISISRMTSPANEMQIAIDARAHIQISSATLYYIV